MRLTPQVLGSRTGEADYSDVQYLDLSGLAVVAIEVVHLLPNLTYLDLDQNRIETVENLESCKELWHLYLCHSKVRSLDGLRHFPVFGTLALTDNQLNWSALKSIQHVHLVEVHLQGNPKLQSDIHYRMHVIDSLPQVWMLDGIMVTASERERVNKFFRDHHTRADLKPIRHKLPQSKFVPSSMKKLMVNGVFGRQSKLLMSHVPLSSPHTTELDWCRLRYILKMFCCELKMVGEYTSAVSYSSVSSASLAEDLLPNLEDLLSERHQHMEQSNMLLLLLVVSLEFSLPARVIESAIETARLTELGRVRCMQLFLLEKKLRCRLCGILLSAAALDKDSGEKEALYPGLYHALHSVILSLMYKAFCGPDGALAEQHRQHSLPPSEHDFEKHRQLLAAEVVQLFCLVPLFFDLLTSDSGVLELAMVATGELDLYDNITILQEELTWDKVDQWQIYQRLAAYILLKVKATMDISTAKTAQYSRRLAKPASRKPPSAKPPAHSPYRNPAAASRRPKSSPSGNTQTGYVSKHRSAQLASTSTVLAAHQPQPVPGLGDIVMIQLTPRVIGHIVSFTNTNSAVVQVQRDTTPAHGPGHAEHILIDLDPLVYDSKGFWKPMFGEMIGARQRTWQSADALMSHPGVTGGDGSDIMVGRRSPAPPPCSPHHSRPNSAANTTIHRGTPVVMREEDEEEDYEDSDTGTESGDDDDDDDSGHHYHDNTHCQMTGAVAHGSAMARSSGGMVVSHRTTSPMPSGAGNTTAVSAASHKQKMDSGALQAHVEMVIQHLQDTGLSKQAVQAKPSRGAAKKADVSASKSSIRTTAVSSAATTSQSSTGSKSYLASRPRIPVVPVGMPYLHREQGIAPTIQSTATLRPKMSPHSAAVPRTATVMHSFDSTVPPVESAGHDSQRLKSAPPKPGQQLATRNVTMGFQSCRQTGRASSWNTVHRSVERSSSATAARVSPVRAPPQPTYSSFAGSLPVTVALQISQNPMTSSAARTAMRHEAWQPKSSSSQTAKRQGTARSRTLGSIPSTRLY